MSRVWKEVKVCPGWEGGSRRDAGRGMIWGRLRRKRTECSRRWGVEWAGWRTEGLSLGLGSWARTWSRRVLLIYSFIQYVLSPMRSLASRPPKGRGLNPEGTWEPLRDAEQGSTSHCGSRCSTLGNPSGRPPGSLPPPRWPSPPGSPREVSGKHTQLRFLPRPHSDRLHESGCPSVTLPVSGSPQPRCGT